MLVKYTRTSVFDEGAAQDGKEPTPTPARFDAEVAEALSDDLPGDREPKFLYCHGKQDGIPVHVKLHDSLDRGLLSRHGMKMTTRRVAFPYTMTSPATDSGRIPTAKSRGTDSITLWSDGSQAYTGNGAIAFGSCGIAYAFVADGSDGKPIRYGYSGSYVDTSASNTDSEIMSAACGIREAICRGYRNIEVRYDAMSIVDSICSPGGTDTQCCFNAFLRVACRYAYVSFTHVKGHSGVAMNEYADVLAKKARIAGGKFYSPLMKDTKNDVTLCIPISEQLNAAGITQASKERNQKFEKALGKMPNLPGMQAYRRKNGSVDYISALTAVVGQNRVNDSFRENVARYPYQKASGIGESGGKIIRMFVSGMSPKVVNAERKKNGIQDVSDLPAIMSQSTMILTRGAMRANSVQVLVSGALSYSSGIPFPELQQSVIDAVDAEQRRCDEARKKIAAAKQNKRTRKAAAKKRQQAQQKQVQQKQVTQKNTAQKNTPQKRTNGDTVTSGQKSRTAAAQGIGRESKTSVAQVIGSKRQTAGNSRSEAQKRVASPVKPTSGIASVKAAVKPQNASHSTRPANSASPDADSTVPVVIVAAKVVKIENGLPVIGTKPMEPAAHKKPKSNDKKHEKKHAKKYAKKHAKKHADAGKHSGKGKKHDKKHGKKPSGGAVKKKAKKGDSPSGKKKKKK